MLRRVNLDRLASGGVLLASMPGRFEPLNEFEQEIRRLGVTSIVCLVGDDEIACMSPEYLTRWRNGQLPCPVLQFPIRDFGAPDDRAGFLDFVRDAANRVLRGETLVIHCAAGFGRTGTFAACILIMFGSTWERAIEAVSAAGSCPETPAQDDVVRWVAQQMTGPGGTSPRKDI